MGRVVMFVLNDVRWDVRVQREATTLAEAGYEVTIIGRPTDPLATVLERERWNGVEIVRVPVPGRFRRWMLGAGGDRGATARWRDSAPRGAPAGPAGPATGSDRRSASPSRLVVRSIRAAARLPLIGGLVRGIDLLIRWRFGTMAWGLLAAAAAPPADVWHAHDLTGLPAAFEARRRNGGRLVYDSHELFTEAGDTASRPGWARAVLRRYEARAIRQADAVITVNDGLAAELGAIATPRRILVVRNTPPAPSPEASAPSSARPDRLRAALGLASDTKIVLYHGGLLRDRGLPQLILAMTAPGLEQAHLVLMGSGPMTPELARHVAESPDLTARVHLLPPVPPADLGAWVASADVGAMPNQPRTANERISTPNKLYECLAAGIPVVSSDFPERRRIIADDPDGPLGALCDPADPASIGAALRSILDLDATATATLRARCLTAARLRWNWEAQSAGLLALYADLIPAGAQNRGPSAEEEGAPLPQRITFVLPSSGAFDSRTRRMALGLGERGHDVLVIARADVGLPDREALAPGVALRRVDAGSAPGAAPVSRQPPRLLATLVRMAQTAARSRSQTRTARLVDRSADIYHAMGFLALPVAADLAADPALGGRVHLLPPVPPSALLDWVASADIGVMANQPRTINERLSTPNKLFECLAAGTPVVSSDFPERRRIVIENPDGPLGALCDPTEPASIGAAIRSILDLDPASAADLRARCRRATAARYDWDTQFERLLKTYARVTGNRW